MHGTRWRTSSNYGPGPFTSRLLLKERTNSLGTKETTISTGPLPMRNDVNVQVNLEAEDTLAVRLISLQVTGPETTRPARELLESQVRTLLDKCTFLEGGPLALIE